MKITRTQGRALAHTALAAVTLVACLLASGGLVAACGDPADDRPPEPTGQPDITGVVTYASDVTNGDIVGSFLVEGGEGDYDKASVTVTADTVWYRRTADGYEVIDAPTPADLTGKRGAVRFTGAVAESYPVQATADWVIVTD